jgi:transketolase N-terminal domain/subunit
MGDARLPPLRGWRSSETRTADGQFSGEIEGPGIQQAMKFDMKSLLRRCVEIDYRYHHRHLPGSLSALPIIASIYEGMTEHDVFILSKGHSCAALYAVLEATGKHPDVSLVHPERDEANGVTITAGSLGHGLPIGVGMAYAKKLRSDPGTVHVLMGDGECQEGTTWEALALARWLALEDGRLQVHVDYNGWQGSDPLRFFPLVPMESLFGVKAHMTKKGQGISMFEMCPEKSVHLLTDEDYATIMKELGA